MQRFSTEAEARAYFEGIRWPGGPVCAHCGNADSDRIYAIAANPKKRIRAGIYKCAECRDQFTVTVGTVMEDSKVPLQKWLIAFYIMSASKTQVSALQLQRQLGLGSYRTAWFLCHRIRYALADVAPVDKLDGTVEADETYIGGKATGHGRGYVKNKIPVVSLVERGGRVRSTVTPKVTGKTVTALLKTHVAETAVLNTDESPVYTKAGKEFAAHDTVNHKEKEYARDDAATGRKATTNAAEGFFGNAKRSIDGTHHSVSGKHLGLYFAEIDFKYNTRAGTDGARTVSGIARVGGKRLMLRRPKVNPDPEGQ
ncbi:MAG: IS1595 family transposase [Vicinamibacterales bacterium]